MECFLTESHIQTSFFSEHLQKTSPIFLHSQQPGMYSYLSEAIKVNKELKSVHCKH